MKTRNKLFDIFLDKFNLAKQKSIPKINSKKVSKANKYNYLPLDEKTVKITKKHIAWQRYMEIRDGKNIKNMLN
jgi:hypothetical protein